MDLIQSITSQLGLSSSQAEGAAGVLFSALRSQLERESFAELEQKIPEAHAWMSRAAALPHTPPHRRPSCHDRSAR